MIHTWPNGSFTRPTVTSPFGPRKAPLAGASTFHQGIDLIWNPLDYNRSSADGVVTFARANGGAGNQVKVHHDDGTETTYDHAPNGGFMVSVGQRVVRGQALSRVGMTGDATGPHCHFETRNMPGGPAIDPDIFMAAHRSGTAGEGATPIQETRNEMSLPRVIKIQNVDANGAAVPNGLSGVHLLLGQDRSFVYPAELATSYLAVDASFHNSDAASSKIPGAQGDGQEIIWKEENVNILLHSLGYQDGALQSVAVHGGGHFDLTTKP